MQEINLYSLVKFYAKNWLLIVSITFLGLVLGFVYSSFIQTPLYKSDATLLLVRSSSLSDSSSQDTILINNYIELFKSKRVLDPVISKQNLNISYDDMVGLVSASNSKSTEVIKIDVSTKDASKSKAFLEDAIVSFKAQVKQLYKIDNVRVVDSPSLAQKPYNIHKENTALLMAILSFVVAIISLFFVYDYRSVDNKKPQLNTDNDGDSLTANVSTKDMISVGQQVTNTTSKVDSYDNSVSSVGHLAVGNTQRSREYSARLYSSRERYPRR